MHQFPNVLKQRNLTNCYQGTIKLRSLLFVKGIKFLRSILLLKYKVIVLLKEEEDCLLSCHLLLA